MFLERARPRYSAEELTERKEKALRYLADPFFMSVLDDAEAAAIGEWLGNTDPAARERCWLLAKGIDTVLLTFRQIVDEAPMLTPNE